MIIMMMMMIFFFHVIQRLKYRKFDHLSCSFFLFFFLLLMIQYYYSCCCLLYVHYLFFFYFFSLLSNSYIFFCSSTTIQRKGNNFTSTVSSINIDINSVLNPQVFQANEVYKTDDNQFVVEHNIASFHTVECTEHVVNRTEYQVFVHHYRYVFVLHNNNLRRKHKQLLLGYCWETLST